MAFFALVVLPNPIVYRSSSLRKKFPVSVPPAQSLSICLSLNPDFNHYGPSLSSGQRPTPLGVTECGDEGSDSDCCPMLDRSSFSRTFNVAALRVAAADCSALERRLRGHLLNWPRVRNVARVPGDDLEPEFRALLRDDKGDGGYRLLSLSRHGGGPEFGREALSPVLYREKLAKKFNCRGFLKFRHLERMSRLKKKKKRKTLAGEEVRVRDGQEKDYSVVEVLGESDKDSVEMSRLLGDEFHARRWRGPTRLLLLDARYTGQDIEELPAAIKAVLKGDTALCENPVAELAQCQLTLFYNYWDMSQILENLLPEGIVVPTGFETVGHIAHLNLRDEHLPYKKVIAQVVLDKNRPKIETVVNKVDTIQNEYRTMQLEVLAGNHSLVTTVIENGIEYQVDLARVYWNSRLATERQRLVRGFTGSDVVCDVFSGVGPITLSAAKKVKYVYANDLNPTAVEYLEKNIFINKLDRKIEVFNMDGWRLICSLFSSQRCFPITQVVMNLPTDALDFLGAFRGIFGGRGRTNGHRLPKIHIYGFSKAENPEFDFHERINMALYETVADIEMHRVRLVAPGKWMLCASFILPRNVAFASENKEGEHYQFQRSYSPSRY